MRLAVLLVLLAASAWAQPIVGDPCIPYTRTYAVRTYSFGAYRSTIESIRDLVRRCADKVPWADCYREVFHTNANSVFTGQIPQIASEVDKLQARLSATDWGNERCPTAELNSEKVRQIPFWCNNLRRDCFSSLDEAIAMLSRLSPIDVCQHEVATRRGWEKEELRRKVACDEKVRTEKARREAAEREQQQRLAQQQAQQQTAQRQQQEAAQRQQEAAAAAAAAENARRTARVQQAAQANQQMNQAFADAHQQIINQAAQQQPAAGPPIDLRARYREIEAQGDRDDAEDRALEASERAADPDTFEERRSVRQRERHLERMRASGAEPDFIDSAERRLEKARKALADKQAALASGRIPRTAAAPPTAPAPAPAPAVPAPPPETPAQKQERECREGKPWSCAALASDTARPLSERILHAQRACELEKSSLCGLSFGMSEELYKAGDRAGAIAVARKSCKVSSFGCGFLANPARVPAATRIAALDPWCLSEEANWCEAVAVAYQATDPEKAAARKARAKRSKGFGAASPPAPAPTAVGAAPAPAALAPAPPSAPGPEWSRRGYDLVKKAGDRVQFRCGPGTGSGLWGTDLYTHDSPVCAAAVHAGVITAAGGEFIVSWEPGQSSYAATTRNGVTSWAFGPYRASFRVAPLPAR